MQDRELVISTYSAFAPVGRRFNSCRAHQSPYREIIYHQRLS